MKKIQHIATDRHHQTWPSWQIVYEWEDELASELKLPLVNAPKEDNWGLNQKIDRIDRRISGKFSKIIKQHFMYFEMRPKGYYSFSNTGNSYPVIIDFWGNFTLEQFKHVYNNCPVLFITSFEIFEELKKLRMKPKLVHFPMSLPTRYKLNPEKKFTKKFDIVLPGRVNSVLLEYVERYCIEFEHIEFLKQKQIDGELYYVSNKQGVLGKFQNRVNYFELLEASKVALYSTPGIDDKSSITNGFNPVTPRLFEMLASGCHVLARYPKNADTDYFDLPSLTPSVVSYEHFRALLSAALNQPIPMVKNTNFLNQHYTVNRIHIFNPYL